MVYDYIHYDVEDLYSWLPLWVEWNSIGCKLSNGNVLVAEMEIIEGAFKIIEFKLMSLNKISVFNFMNKVITHTFTH